MSDTTADAAKRKAKRTAARRKAKRAAAKRAAMEWAARRRSVGDRDHWMCRACREVAIVFGDPHHIVYRSAGGSDDLSNLVWLCRTCHDAEHAHDIRITGTADDLRIERRR